MDAKKPLTVVELTVENVKRVKAARIRAGGAPVVTLTGPNGGGKSSVLDAFAWAIGGADAQPIETIRRGADHAQVVADFGELVVTKKWRAGGRPVLEVKGKDGARFASPQALLDGLVSKMAMDPLQFLALSSTAEGRRKQADLVKQALGLDFSALDAEKAEAYEERTVVNRELKALEARLAATPAVEAPDEPESVEDLLAEQELLLASKADQDVLRGKHEVEQNGLAHHEHVLSECQKRVEELEVQLAAARKARDEAEGATEKARRTLEAAFEAAADLPDLGPALEAVKKRLSEADAVNDRVRKKRARAELAVQVEAKRKESDGLTARLTALDAERQKRMESVEFPIPGLGFSEHGLTLDSFPLEQASRAQQVRLAVGVVLASKPTIRVVPIRDANVLDEDSVRAVEEMAEASGAQVWMERAGRGEVGVLIEDGEVVDGGGEAVGAGEQPLPAEPAPAAPPASGVDPVMQFGHRTKVMGKRIRDLADSSVLEHVRVGEDWLADPKHAASPNRAKVQECLDHLKAEAARRGLAVTPVAPEGDQDEIPFGRP